MNNMNRESRQKRKVWPEGIRKGGGSTSSAHIISSSTNDYITPSDHFTAQVINPVVVIYFYFVRDTLSPPNARHSYRFHRCIERPTGEPALARHNVTARTRNQLRGESSDDCMKFEIKSYRYSSVTIPGAVGNTVRSTIGITGALTVDGAPVARTFL